MMTIIYFIGLILTFKFTVKMFGESWEKNIGLVILASVFWPAIIALIILVAILVTLLGYKIKKEE